MLLSGVTTTASSCDGLLSLIYSDIRLSVSVSRVMSCGHLSHAKPLATAFAMLPGGINIDVFKDSHGKDVSPVRRKAVV